MTCSLTATFHHPHRAFVSAILLTAICPASASAAVRTCGARIESPIVTAPTEIEGKKQALASWRAKAAALGPGFDGWHVAAEKILKCFPQDGQFACMAVGNPCIIQQNPNQKPAGKDRKGEPL